MAPDKKRLLAEEQRESPATATTAQMDREVSARFLTIVRDLVWELHPHLRRSTPVGLDSDFDRDLALDSLGRAELILRLDKAFKVRLPDHLLSEADTPQRVADGGACGTSGSAGDARERRCGRGCAA